MCYLYDNSSILHSYQRNFEEAENNFDLGKELLKKYSLFLPKENHILEFQMFSLVLYKNRLPIPQAPNN
ncbi:hypothetical protein NEF87_001041 [Candidatus Lokiarchaeum ossiferum]|uniref:Uncharacterized protein n=1 Tax=Candidatus Lokiarchaeum ossiferum TaxID=2951803 RepID=A0ABY6HML7_9ARCH|nr:hypothetical protein NEF87_001041 [Candidatus Lokiarchaeum sp. B-35]